MKFLKIVGGLILGVVVIGIVLFFMVGTSLFMSVKEVANQPVEQTVLVDDGIKIVVPLVEQYALTFKDLDLCIPESKKEDMFFKKIDAGNLMVSTSCSNDKCTTNVYLEDKDALPTDIKIYLNKNGSCQQETIAASEGTVSLDSYEARVEFTEDLLSKLNISGTYKVKPKTSTNYSSWQMMGSKKLSLNYSEKVSGDTLLINDIEKAKIIYK